MSDHAAPDPPLDVLIAGAGPAGHALALALHRDAGGALRLAVADPAPGRAPPPGRAYALAPAAVAFLSRLGVWPALAARAQPVRAMRISDSRVRDPVRPALLRFDAGEGPLAHIVEESDLAGALAAAVAAAGIPTIDSGVAAFAPSPAALAVEFRNGARRRAALLAAADGARSPCRTLAGLPSVGWDYGQIGLVAVVSHARDHEGVAVQHFLPGGPFAILPMTGGRASIVWTDTEAAAAATQALHRDDRLAEIERRFGAWLGPIRLETPLAAFPIRYQMARRLVGDRIALVGDAAHVVHPLAGQGLNLGLEDAEALARRVIAARRLGLDAGDATALTAYERDRRAANVAMGVAADLLNRLFSNDATPARLARDFGLGLVDRIPGLKEFFVRQAAGRADAA